MMTVLKIVIALILFGVIIFVHELGHFWVAKACGVRVNEFAIGMGPKLFSFGKKETRYSLRLLPLGGYCAMEGEDEKSDDPRAFGNKPVFKRILVVVAGVFMNFVLGYIVLLIAVGFFMPLSEGQVLFPTTTIAQLDENSANYQSGLRAGDTVLSINSRPVVTRNDMMVIMQSDEDGVMPMMVERTVNGERVKVSLPNVTFDVAQTADGGRYLKYDFILYGVPQTFWNTFTEAAKNEWSLISTVWGSLGDIVTGKYGLNDLSGPVGTVDIIGDMVEQAATGATREDVYSILMIFSLISVNVGVFNLLPLPALDGGRLVFLLFEAIFRRPIPPKYEGMVHFIGFALLLILMLVVTFSDIMKLLGLA